ncbi:MAG TPA: right-handed parallel beta-helix repeat-containing protein [Gaiellaceae bacterium]|nr:right-handed parallel beta-helix repeat-containing protein [Gaiellaceae bacterium]
MSFTLRGRLESRLAAGLVPLFAAAGLAAAITEWWPLALAAAMLGVGLVFDVAYDRWLEYQPGWLAPPLALLELGAVMGVVYGAGISAPLTVALAFFGGSWLLGQVLVHGVFPYTRLSYGEEGGELGRIGPALAAVVLATLGVLGGVALAMQPPTVRLAAGIHQGPLVLDHAQKLVGEPGAVVRGGILITADNVTVRNVTVVGGESGIEVDDAHNVTLERVRVSGAELDGIHVRRATVHIRDCLVHSPASEYAQGIDISFGFDLAPSDVEGCTVVGGREGIVTHFTMARVADNRVVGTSLRGLTLTEMSMAVVEGNHVEDSLGVGIYCGDYSECEIDDNRVRGVRADEASGDKTRMGFGIVAHHGAEATISGNEVSGVASRARSFLGARISAG